MINIIFADNLRLLIKKANNLQLSKNDIISILPKDNRYYLIYQK